MSFGSYIRTKSRRLLASPVWTGTAVTLMLVMPTLLSPTVPLWISLSLLVVVGSLMVIAFHILYKRYGRLGYSEPTSTETTSELSKQTPFDLLKQQYASGEIDTETFERRLETLLRTEERTQQVDSHEKQEAEVGVRNG